MNMNPRLGQPHPDHDRGLAYDVSTLLSRRRALGLLGGAGLVTLVGCSSSDQGSGTTSTASASASGSSSSSSSSAADVVNAADVVEVPDETAGPYPGDGSNGRDVLTQSGIVRSDIRKSIGTGSATAAGIPLTVHLTVLSADRDNAAYAGAAVYLWHCDRDGKYSMYSDGVENENYLRGVQECGADGTVSFTTIFPACYAGRWPHIHFEVYASVDVATSSGPIVKTSQIALPDAVCRTVYGTSGYDASTHNLAQISLASDNVFGDDSGVHQLATVTGGTSQGYSAHLTIAA
ncbi:intradiol ring-cleavage dioxygenase [Luteipulveratus mongoliensis]|uniref:3,4-dioxygenase subunit beta n=1 Tax=Luteipulveratus mongoliensis TaxID=571913 RepID=A0A0K1JJG1_9MICO|nr:intradiol ring-cleavage dioxygenase [Luteipulveratus mongoliensis]AKU16710.1 3,4-dioxygenase subunit beta [Luteipulveratus mongoliensis]